MYRSQLDYPAGWREVSRNAGALAATMVLAPGESEGGPDNFHPASDQWTFVVSGTGVAIVDGAEQALAPGVLLRIEQISGGSLHVQQGALYPALFRLEQQGLIESEWGVYDNNRRAKFYRITKTGQKQLASEVSQWEQATEIVGRFLALKGARA